MKKFNSILAIATVALTSIFGFTSCDKNDDVLFIDQPAVPTIQEDKAQEVTEDAYLYMPATKEQVKYMDVTCRLSVSGTTMEVKLSDMVEVKDVNRLKQSTEQTKLYEVFHDEDATDEFVMYEYNLGKVTSAKVLSIYCTPYIDTVDHEIDYIIGPSIYRGEYNLYSNKNLELFYKGIYDLKGHTDVFNKFHK